VAGWTDHREGSPGDRDLGRKLFACVWSARG
jgi:hypothetical protein